MLDLQAAAHPGGVHLVWRQGDYEEQTLRARHFDARTGEWGPIEDLGPTDAAPSVAADAAGNAVLVWHYEVGDKVDGSGEGGGAGEGGDAGWGVDDERVLAARYDSEQERWSEPHELDSYADGPQVAMHADGSALALWRRFFGDEHVYAAHMTPDGSWAPAEPIDATAEPRSTQTGVVLHADGDATAYLERRVWNDEDGYWGGQLAAVRYSKADGAWSEPVPLQTSLREEYLTAQLAGNQRGDAVLLWWIRSGDPGGRNEIYTASYDEPSGTWTKPDQLTEISPNRYDWPDWGGGVALQDDGQATVVYYHFRDDHFQVSALRLDRDHAPGSEEPLASDEDARFSQPAVVALEDGLMAVWWNDYELPKYKMDSRIFRDGIWQASESTRPMRERTSLLRLADVRDVGVLAYWVTESGISTSWHP